MTNGHHAIGWLAAAEALNPALNVELRPAVRAVRITPDPGAFQGWAAEAAGPAVPCFLAERAVVVLDFGQHTVGRLRLGFSAATRLDAPLRLRLRCGEIPAELAPGGPLPADTMVCHSWLQEEIVHVDHLPAVVAPARRFAFRYVAVEVLCLSRGHEVGLETAVAEATAATFAVAPPCPSWTARERALDAVAQRTLRQCLQSVFEDGPKRDQRLWLGDLRLQALANAVTVRRFDVVKRCLLLFAGLARADGLVEACVYHRPTPAPSGNAMPDYALLFVPTLLDYARDSDDASTADDLWPVALRQLQLLLPAFGTDGHLLAGHSFGWTFIDWKPGLEKAGPLLGVALYSAAAGVMLGRRLGRHHEVEWVDQWVRSYREVFRRHWAAPEGGWADPRTRQQSCALSAWAILGGVCTGAAAVAELKRVLADPAALRPAGPYLWHHLVQACGVAGAPDLGRELLNAYWGAMLDRGAETFWEVFDPADDRASPYGDARLNSYCHAWSCTPAWFLRGGLRTED